MRVTAYVCPLTQKIFKTERWQRKCTYRHLKELTQHNRSVELKLKCKATVREFCSHATAETIPNWLAGHQRMLHRATLNEFELPKDRHANFAIRGIQMPFHLVKEKRKITREYYGSPTGEVVDVLVGVLLWQETKYNRFRMYHPFSRLPWLFEPSWADQTKWPDGFESRTATVCFTEKTWPEVWEQWRKDSVELILKGVA